MKSFIPGGAWDGIFYQSIIAGEGGQGMVYFDSKLHTACPYIQWPCEINWKPEPDWSFSHYMRIESSTGMCGGFLESWYSAEALYSPRLWLQRLSEDVCSGVPQWQDWLVTE